MAMAKRYVEYETLEPNLMSFCWTLYWQLEFLPTVVLFLILQVSSSTFPRVHVACVTQNSYLISPLYHLEIAYENYFSA